MDKCFSHEKCIQNAITLAEKLCLERNIKFTKSRKKILKVIWESHIPIKAYDILKILNSEDKASYKPITVYRILDFLIENNMVHKLHSQNSFMGCSHPAIAHNCGFMICKTCQNAWECCDLKLLSEIKSKKDTADFKVDRVVLEIYGVCQKCQ